MKLTNIDKIIPAEFYFKTGPKAEFKARFDFVTSGSIKIGEYSADEFPWSEKTFESLFALMENMQKDIEELIFDASVFKEEAPSKEEKEEVVEKSIEDPFKDNPF